MEAGRQIRPTSSYRSSRGFVERRCQEQQQGSTGISGRTYDLESPERLNLVGATLRGYLAELAGVSGFGI